MRIERFEWSDATRSAREIRRWNSKIVFPPDVSRIEAAVIAEGDEAVLRFTAEHDAVELTPEELRVDSDRLAAALATLDPQLREALEVAAANVRGVAEELAKAETTTVELAQGHTVTLRGVPARAAGVYVPGGRAAYPSSVLMCCIPAQVAGVERIALASPPGPEGRPHSLVLAAAALCGVEEIYAMGGAQAIFALAYGTETISPVDVVVGPGNAWVREAKRAISGERGIDSLAGPSELMLIAGHDTDPEWAALDLCSQAEHGPDGALVAVAVEDAVLQAVVAATERVAMERPGVEEAPLALVQVPDLSDAIDLANAFAPEHLELMEEDAALLVDRVRTAGCVFVGRYAATAFGDYAAGSNHVLPTGGAGRFSGPLGPDTFTRRLAEVRIDSDAAAALAPYVDALAQAEGFPVHGESAMIRR